MNRVIITFGEMSGLTATLGQAGSGIQGQFQSGSVGCMPCNHGHGKASGLLLRHAFPSFVRRWRFVSSMRHFAGHSVASCRLFRTLI